MSAGNGLYVGHVSHVRLLPFVHRFRYRVFSLAVDLDTLPDLAKRLWPLSHNRFNLLSVHDRDLGAADGTPPKRWVEQCLKAGGFEADRWRIVWHGFPRLWGFVFNPLSLYFCFDQEDRLRAVLHEVRNTFGERHSYLIAVEPGAAVIHQQCDKAFHVSPFFPIAGRYRFRLTAPGETLSIMIRYLDEAGATQLVAMQSGQRQPLTSMALLRAVLAHPLMTLKVVAGIHWQALRLWRRGAKFYRKPAPPAAPVSLLQPLSLSPSGPTRVPL
jgi:uncharacterized protein